METWKDIIKPPFANYDIVVYFGCGLFALPFLHHYILTPFKINLPVANFNAGVHIADTLISTLSLLFLVYIIGHIVAYFGSQFIEKAMDAFLGKTSSIVLLSATSTPQSRNTLIRKQLRDGLCQGFQKSSRLANGARLLVHLPVLPVYLIIVWLGIFGFYDSRVPPNVLEKVGRKIKNIGLRKASVSHDAPWFKAVEGYVINNHPVATARMYNYLVISGLFRSVSLIFLSAIWLELYYLAHRFVTGHLHVSQLMFSQASTGSQALNLLPLGGLYIFSLFSYLKFQRRYIEEAVFAFALTKD